VWGGVRGGGGGGWGGGWGFWGVSNLGIWPRNKEDVTMAGKQRFIPPAASRAAGQEARDGGQLGIGREGVTV